MSIHTPKPFALIILDGWGHRDEKENNAIAQAHKPNWDRLIKNYPHTLISGCGRCVGLPDDQMGNSEVGHLNMGAGRVVHQDLTRIDLSIEDKSFFSNTVLCEAIDNAVKTNKAIHILGLLSPGGVHSHEKHILTLLDLTAQRKASKTYVHAFLDGRDTPPRSAETSLQLLTEHCKKINCGQIASLIGRYYAMDRDQRWDRVQQAYDLLTLGKATAYVENAVEGLIRAYARGENDEFVQATSIAHDQQTAIKIQDGDIIIFMNFRADRAREITRAFIEPGFNGFKRKCNPKLAEFVSLTQYDATLKTKAVYTPISLNKILGEYLSTLKLKQLRIAETEKYAHVTFFFNGGVEKAYEGEDRILIPSPKVPTYDLQPEMSAYEVTDKLLTAIKSMKYDVIICNFANPDMVGHTGNLQATIKAIEVIDDCLGKILSALKNIGGEALITADHGNAEMMFDAITGQAHTAHTHELVPLIYFGRPAHCVINNGVLADVAPSLLALINRPQPTEMTGRVIFKLEA